MTHGSFTGSANCSHGAWLDDKQGQYAGPAINEKPSRSIAHLLDAFQPSMTKEQQLRPLRVYRNNGMHLRKGSNFT